MTRNRLNPAQRYVGAVLAASVLLSVSVPAGAVERIRADENTCAKIQETLQSAGALIIQYPSARVANLLLYDRYVSSCAYCDPGEDVAPATVPASDNPECVVQRCVPIGGGQGTPACTPSEPETGRDNRN
ncbi:hypothetical protein [Oricola nitratireducens]|jgi:hypothetical protein|uniref:hypothetical protein n=1 Tax=Oricola nitratireducens TaxID=2775868 RepID=UPI0018663E6E|nr:hypothetical protein [Oricola nitratireducens]